MVYKFKTKLDKFCYNIKYVKFYYFILIENAKKSALVLKAFRMCSICNRRLGICLDYMANYRPHYF